MKKTLFACLLLVHLRIFAGVGTEPNFIAYRDSVGLEKKGSKNYILHKVEPKETLFAISRKYNVPIAQLQQSNSEIKSGLNVGQIIRVPYKLSAIKTTTLASAKTHTVAPKETLFSISKKYKVSIEDLKRANPGATSGLKTGQELVIPGKGNLHAAPQKNETAFNKKVAYEEKQKDEVRELSKPEKEIKTEEDKSKKDFTTGTKSLAISTPPPAVATSYKKINESGFASLMENSPEDLKYLALHKSAPVGTIIQVRNDENNQKIFVRVSGKLTSNTDKVILKMSPKALERLGAKGDRIPVSISYIP